MMFVTATAFLVVTLVGAGLVEGQLCKFTLQTDLDPKKEPVVLAVRETDIRGTGSTSSGNADDNGRGQVETLVIAEPRVVDGDIGVIKLYNRQKLMLACSGTGNLVNGNGKNEAYLTCNKGKLTMDGKEVNAETTSCTKGYARSILRETDDTCGNEEYRGKIFQTGFMLGKNSWFPLLQICHNVELGATLYESHSLVGESIRGAIKCSDRKGFAQGLKTLYPGINPDKAFNKAGQKAAFKKILGAKIYSSYVNDTSYLARGHLAPDADFIFNSEQMATYYFVNAAPQFQQANAGNWLVVENAVRDLAAKEELTLDITTGTYGVLELVDSTNHKKPMYLSPDEGMIPVPKVMWKMVQHPITKSCTIVVTHNNIFLKNPPTTICPPKTPDGWPELHDISKGYTYYCDYEGFVKTVKWAPDNDCKDLFEFPEI